MSVSSEGDAGINRQPLGWRGDRRGCKGGCALSRIVRIRPLGILGVPSGQPKEGWASAQIGKVGPLDPANPEVGKNSCPVAG